jgi:DNA-binding transcriptional LysR family regulator
MSEDLLILLARELDAFREQHPEVLLRLDPVDAFYLIGVLQLALRHPELPETSRDCAERIKAALVALIAHSPALAAVVRMGDDPFFDS